MKAFVGRFGWITSVGVASPPNPRTSVNRGEFSFEAQLTFTLKPSPTDLFCTK